MYGTRHSRQLAEKAVNAFQDVFNKHFVDALLREAKAAASKALPDERNFNKGQSRKQQLRKKLTADNQRKQAQLQIDETIKSLAAALYAGNVAELLVEEMNKREKQQDSTKVALTINRRQQEGLKAQERRSAPVHFSFSPLTRCETIVLSPAGQMNALQAPAYYQYPASTPFGESLSFLFSPREVLFLWRLGHTATKSRFFVATWPRKVKFSWRTFLCLFFYFQVK